ncbi:MAG: complex I NDUFA9 subunit family protein [Gammaproteobacteria bacterium]
MLIKHIAVLGGTGFVGRSLCNRLSELGYEVKVLTRNREYNRDELILLPGLQLIEADIYDQGQLNDELAGCDAVINLVGILNERGNSGKGFHKAHVEIAEKMLNACASNGIKRILQMSALNADADKGASHYLRSKGMAEDLLHNNSNGIKVTSFRPSVIFGRSDSFFNRFAKLLRLTPLVFPLACHSSKFAPVYVLDVVEMMALSLTRPESYGQRYQLCGPKTYSLEQLVQYTADVLELKRKIIPLNNFLSRVQAAVFDYVPGKPFSTDNYLSSKADSVCSNDDLARFGIEARSIESIVPGYLRKQGYRSRYTEFRSEARRS